MNRQDDDDDMDDSNAPPEPDDHEPPVIYELPQKKISTFSRYYTMLQEWGLVKTTVWLILTIVYQALGAWLFTSTEGPYDDYLRLSKYNAEMDIWRTRIESLSTLLDEVIVSARDLPRMEAETAINASLTAYEMVTDRAHVPVSLAPVRWTMFNALFFSNSIYTSVGFGGRLAPKTDTGRWVCMAYAFFGVPFMLAMTGDLGLVVFEGLYYLWYLYTKPKKIAARTEEYDLDLEWDPETPEIPPKKRVKTQATLELHDKIDGTYPVSMGIIMSILSLALSSALVQFYEADWTYFDANYYFVQSFLTIGLGDISPSAPKNPKTPQATLIPHIVLLLFSMTFIGMSQHVVGRRIETAYFTINYNIHMEYRTRLVEPDISTMKENEGPIQEESKISLLARKLGFLENFYYGSMDRSRRAILHQNWHRKANMKSKSVQTNLPKREIGIQHLLNVNEETDTMRYGEKALDMRPPPKKVPEPDGRIQYLYNVD